jgi:hypothetical protein
MSGRYDEWLAREPDLERPRVVIEDEPLCDDCGVSIASGARSVITDPDSQSRIYCPDCGRAREKAGWLFDSRPLEALRKSA